MAGGKRFLGAICLISLCLSVIGLAGSVTPIDLDLHRSAALEAFVVSDGSFGGLQETYEALWVFQILGIDQVTDVKRKTCLSVVDRLSSSSSSVADLYHAFRVNSILKCEPDTNKIKDASSKFQTAVGEATSLENLHQAILGLLILKEEGFSVAPVNVDGILDSIKSLSQRDGRWRYNPTGGEASVYATGIALEALAGVISLSTDEIDKSKVSSVKRDIVKLFDIIESYDDGALFFSAKELDIKEYRGPLSTTAAVIRGMSKYAAVAPGQLDIPGEKIVGLAKFLLSVGVPGSAKDLYYQIDSLSNLETSRLGVPLILSLPASDLSLTSKDLLKVKVTTVFGSKAPPLTVILVRALDSNSKNVPALENKDLRFDSDNSVYYLDFASLNVDVGKYYLSFKILLHESESESNFATPGIVQVPVVITGIFEIDGGEIGVLEADGTGTSKTLDLTQENDVALSASHLQRLILAFRLSSPLGQPFDPQQNFLKLRHESGVEHVFLVGGDDKQYKIVLDFLGLADKLYYLSGSYRIQLGVGDAAMENSFLWSVGQLALELPKAPEKAARPPAQPADPYSRFGPAAEIAHIFRAPEKRPPEQLSLAFSALTLVPLLVFLFGLLRLGANLKGFPASPTPALFAVLFHVGLGAVLALYALFWLKLDLFTALKALVFLGGFLVLVGHRALAHLASTSAKLKSS
ncbi:ribophorin II (RPN2) family protein [Wolffia australiana]